MQSSCNHLRLPYTAAMMIDPWEPRVFLQIRDISPCLRVTVYQPEPTGRRGGSDSESRAGGPAARRPGIVTLAGTGRGRLIQAESRPRLANA